MKDKFFAAGWHRSRSERPRPKRAKVDLGFTRLESRWLLTTGPGIVEYATTSKVSEPIGAVLGADGNLWVTEYAAKELAAFNSAGSLVKTIARSGQPVQHHLGLQRHTLVHRKRHDTLYRQRVHQRNWIDTVCPAGRHRSAGAHRRA